MAVWLVINSARERWGEISSVENSGIHPGIDAFNEHVN
jgi:hypothetical protein